jgi:hypothetical protein
MFYRLKARLSSLAAGVNESGTAGHLGKSSQQQSLSSFSDQVRFSVRAETIRIAMAAKKHSQTIICGFNRTGVSEV